MQSRIDILIHLRKARSPTTLDIMTNKLVRDAEAQNKSVLVFPHNGTSIELRELFSRCEEIFT